VVAPGARKRPAGSGLDKSSRPEKKAKVSHDPNQESSTALNDIAKAAELEGPQPMDEASIHPESPRKQKRRERPTPPDFLLHLVIGINEVMKAMERQTADLASRIRELQNDDKDLLVVHGVDPMAENDKADGLPSHLIPTAPPTGDLIEDKEQASGSVSKDRLTLPRSATRTPLRTIYVCLEDINPPHLVQAIPLYVTSYNSLVRQYRGLFNAKHRNTGKEASGAKLPDSVMETLLVPLNAGSELELAKVMGLRRVATFGMTVSIRVVTLATWAHAERYLATYIDVFPALAGGPINTEDRQSQSYPTAFQAARGADASLGNVNKWCLRSHSVEGRLDNRSGRSQIAQNSSYGCRQRKTTRAQG
jgi:hypothetical protein